MAKMITDLPERFEQDADDLVVIYDILQERTSTIKAKTFRGAVTHTAASAVATPPSNDLTDTMFDGRLIKVLDFWRDDTTDIDGTYREYQAIAVDPLGQTVEWGNPILHTPRDAFVFQVGTQPNSYEPPTDQSDALYGGVAVIAGDKIRWQVDGSTTGKEIIQGPCTLETDGSINWGVRSNPNAAKIHNSDSLDHPALNDEDYSVDEYILGQAGNIYGPYVELQTDELLAWPLYTRREPHTYYTSVDTDVDARDTTALNATLESLSPYPFDGDTLIVNIGTQDKQYRYTIEQVDSAEDAYRPPSGFQVVARENPNTSITFTEDTDLAWPTQDDEKYSAGDYMSIPNDILFGPYVNGASSDIEAWPLTHQRSPKNWVATAANYADSLGTGVTAWDGALAGDTLTYAIGSVQRIMFDIVKADAGDEDYNPAGGFELTNRRNANAQRTLSTTEEGRPARNDEIYPVGDLIRSADGSLFGPYVDGSATDKAAWPLRQRRSSPRTFEVVLASNAPGDFFNRDPNGTEYANALEGDTLSISIAQGTKRIKQDFVRVDSNDPDDYLPASGFDWTLRRSGKPLRMWPRPFPQNIYGRPVEDLHDDSPGDYIKTLEGNVFGPYAEGASDAKASWPLYQVRANWPNYVGNVHTDAEVRSYDVDLLIDPVAGDDVVFDMNTGKMVVYTLIRNDLQDESFEPASGFHLGLRRNGRAAVWHTLTTSGQPERNEDLYSTGDLIVASDGKVYGPYVEAQDNDEDAAPYHMDLAAAASGDNPVITKDGDSGTKYRLNIDEDGQLYVEETA